MLRVGRPRAPVLLALAVAVTAVSLAPVLVTLGQAAGVAPSEAVALLGRPLVGTLLGNTVGIVAAGSALAVVLGTGTAVLIERTALPGIRVWRALAVAPLAVPPFISSYAWLSISPALEGFAGALLVVVLSYYPLVFLPVAAALRGLDPALEDSARALGRGPVGVFAAVVLPQLRPALLGGTLLMALHLLGEFGAFALLRFRTVTTELYAEYRTGAPASEAALLATVLLGLSLLAVAAELRVRGAGRLARFGAGVRRAPRRAALGRFRWAALAVLALLAVGSLGVPLGTIGFWLFRHGADAVTPEEVTAGRLLASALSSLRLGLAGAFVTVLAAWPLAMLAVRNTGAVATVLERAAYVTQGVPAIVVALALTALTLGVLPALYQSATLLAISYAILFLPLALVSLRAVLGQVEQRHEDAARALGLGGAAVTRRLLLPLAAPGIGAAAALVFNGVVTELTATLLLAPIGTRTLATEVWADTSTLAFAAAAPYAALMIALSLGSALLLGRRFGAGATVG